MNHLVPDVIQFGGALKSWQNQGEPEVHHLES